MSAENRDSGLQRLHVMQFKRTGKIFVFDENFSNPDSTTAAGYSIHLDKIRYYERNQIRSEVIKCRDELKVKSAISKYLEWLSTKEGLKYRSEAKNWLRFNSANAIEIEGPWDRGFSLQLHTLSSVFLGEDEYGHKKYDNKYSEVGELLNQCKYHNDRSAIPRLAKKVLQSFKHLSEFDYLIPVPPTNTHRKFQLVSEIANLICLEVDIQLLDSVFEVRVHPELKNIDEKEKRMGILKSSICPVRELDIKGKRVLVFDDLYRSGSTLSIICELLRQFAPARVCVLTLTKTRSRK